MAAVIDMVSKFPTLVQPVPAIEAVSEEIIRFSHPALDFEKRPLAGLPFTTLTELLVVLGLYGLLVVYGLVQMPSSEELEARREAAKKRKEAGESEKGASGIIKLAMIVYNTVQVLLCGWMAATAFHIMQDLDFDFDRVLCSPQVYKLDALAAILYIFYVSKVLDMLDTVFMIIRGKWDQFSFLHVYHHISILTFYFVNAHAAWGGPQVWPVFANSLVHFVMYGYYLMTALGVRVLPPQIVTTVQLLQFVSMMSQGIMVALRSQDASDSCDFPTRIAKAYVVYIFSLFVLFLDFFLRRYHGKGKKDAEDKKRK